MVSAARTDSESNPTSISKNQIVATPSETWIAREIADRYVILSSIGSGAMGTVYKARHKHLGRELAVKMLRADAAHDENSRKRFELEAKSASTLAHPNLVSVSDYGFLPDGMPFLVMDYVEGNSLATVLKEEKQLSDERLLNILTQICCGLSHAHQKGIVHRDLKPSNILLTTNEDGHPDCVKVVDFGLAKPIVGGDQDLTHTGQIFGTPLYMSPEQCQGKRLDGRADIYAIGCLMYRMVAGKLPFTGDNPVITIVMHVKEAPPPIPPAKLSSPFLQALAPIIEKCLQKDPEARYQTAFELRAALQKAAANEATVTQELPATAGEPVSSASIRGLIAGSAICFTIAAGIVGLITTSLLHNHTNEVRRVTLNAEPSPIVSAPQVVAASATAPPPRIVAPAPRVVAPAPAVVAPAPHAISPRNRRAPAKARVALPKSRTVAKPTSASLNPASLQQLNLGRGKSKAFKRLKHWKSSPESSRIIKSIIQNILD